MTKGENCAIVPATMKLIIGTALVLLGAGCIAVTPELNDASAGENAGDEIPLGREMEFETIERGSNSGYTVAECAAVSDEEEFRGLWRRLHSPRSTIPDPPELRFDRGLVLAVFMGQQPTGGYAVTIRSVRRAADELVVEIDRREPGADEMVTQALTSPYHLVWVGLEDTGIPVRFLNCPAEQ